MLRKRGVIIFWSIFIATALFRVSQSAGWEAPVIGDCLRREVSGTGEIDSDPERKESGQVFIVRVDRLDLSGQDLYQNRAKVNCGSDLLLRMKTKPYPRLSYGDRIRFRGNLSAPYNFGSDNGRTFDYKGYLAKDNVFFEIKSADVGIDGDVALGSTIDDSKEKKRGGRFSIASFLYRLKRSFVSHLERALGEPHAGLASGLVVGEKAALGKELLDDFRMVGLIHIVVLSGYNITIVGDAMRKILSFLPRVWGIAIGACGIVLFGILVGAGATVVRSCIMALVALSADMIRRDYDVSRALALAGLIMIIENPMILAHDPSFQLSFLATLGLVMLSSPVESRLGFITERFGLRGIVASTIATQIFVTPYILHMMGQVSIVGLAANILVLPFIPVTMLAVFLTGMTGFISVPIAQAVGYIAHFLLSYEIFIVDLFAGLSFSSIKAPPISGWWIVAFYGLLLGGYTIAMIRQRRKDSSLLPAN